MFITNLKNLREVTLEIARLEKECNRPKYSSSEYDENLKKCREKRKELLNLNLLDKNEMRRLNLSDEEITMARKYYCEGYNWIGAFRISIVGTEQAKKITTPKKEMRICETNKKHIIRTFSRNYSYANKR